MAETGKRGTLDREGEAWTRREMTSGIRFR
jgi:hypothetical protein